MAFYADALTCVEEVTSEVSQDSLRALLLLILFCLFYPRKGDIWKLLDYACRLSIELGYHTEQEVGRVDERQRDLQRSTFWGLYAIERIVGQLFGRCSDLPEAIITTEYPTTVSSPSTGPGFARELNIAHHYRLVYLRSEIYQDLYLPATLPDFDLQWYKERHATLVAWRQELEFADDVTSLVAVTCNVGYCATICFLFQPLMLRALSKTTELATGDDSEDRPAIIPQDNYWAACELIKAYELVLCAPPDSSLGAYPMTFLSAHYIYLAGLTLMAHFLLALDGRAFLLNPLAEEVGEFTLNGRPIDFGSISEVTGSCLVLLSWCADKFPGMEGMLSVFKRLSEKVVPALIRRGLA
ncbi:uncharacterized protein EYB26_002407 [Neofusicoccum parvum]|uniref:Uncharacterized protein EYB26_002407 n=1 Tax=Neofusicoccum parvum TaxID=310453 RepID=A0ACB5SQ04_9PEZI|nr:uncharacterized protein EYB26_002407 [Neofusicoccum parvum]